MSLMLLALASLAVTTEPPLYYRDIRPLIEQKCLFCHAQSGVAFAFDDPERTYDFRAAIAAAVTTRRMPPWMAEPGHQDYHGDYSLSAEELELIAQWATADYPKGEPQATSQKPSVNAAFIPDIRIPVTGSSEFLPDQQQRDDYRCFIAQWPLKTAQYVTGIGAVPGNPRISHHAIIYVAEARFAPIYADFVKAEGGQGYRCFGGPLPDWLGDADKRAAFEAHHPDGVAELSRGQFWLAHWAPGMEGYQLPRDTGIPVAPGSVIILQMHYYTGFAPDQADPGTSLGFQVRKHVRKPAMNWPLTNVAWLHGRDNQSLVVPANGELTVDTDAALTGFDAYIAGVSGRPLEEFGSLELYSANLHMHLIGAAGTVTFTDSNKRSQVLLNVPRYEFGWQRDFFLASPLSIPRTQLDQTRLKVSCTFHNPHSHPVYGGYSSDDEMCYNFSLIAAVPESKAAAPAGSKDD